MTLVTTNDNNWKYYRYDLDEPISDFPHFDPLWQCWQSKRKNGLLPAWRDFDFDDFRGWYGFLIVYDVLHDPFDLKYRLFGSEMVDMYKTEYTGKTIRQNKFAIEDCKDLEHFEGLYKERKVGASTGPIYWDNRHWRTLSYLDLPLSADGTTITHYLTAMRELK